MNEDVTRQATGKLFGDLWHRYDNDLFEQSVNLFAMRFEANGWDLNWFKGKRCLDVGCGGGRYTIAMARLGAEEAIGVDISVSGLADANRRAQNIPNARFVEGSALDLPFEDNSFDFVVCSGVLHHTPNAEKGARQIFRVLKPGGKVYFLLYGTGGLRWPTIMQIRPFAQKVGYDVIDQAMKLADLPANKQRTFLDDFFVPLIDFYDWERVQNLLEPVGFTGLERWTKGKLDHESSVEVQRTELQQLFDLFNLAAQQNVAPYPAHRVAFEAARTTAESALQTLDDAVANHKTGVIDQAEHNDIIFGWGHHRVTAVKP